MDLKAIRQASLRETIALGHNPNENLPLLDAVEEIRSANEISARILALFAYVSCSYGFAKAKAIEWLRANDLYEHLATSEEKYLDGASNAIRPNTQWMVEALWALTWVTSHQNELDFSKPCSSDFIGIFPDIKNGEAANKFLESASHRAVEEVVRAADLAYCLHWSVRDLQLKGKMPDTQVSPMVIVERRRSLEWVITNEPWDEIELDT